MSHIARVHARQVLDSRGHPTIEVDLVMSSGVLGRAAVPAGASTGRYEALELRDGGDAWLGQGVNRAIASVQREIAPAVVGLDPRDGETIDALLADLDGTSSFARLGGNAVLGVSLAAARAAAADAGQPLWRYLSRSQPTLPIPMLDALDGGVHADNRLIVQEFMLVPIGARSFSEALRIGAETYHQLGQHLLAGGLGRAVGEDGGFAAPLESTDAALELLLAAIELAGYRPGVDVGIALDAAASELVVADGYSLDAERGPFTSRALVAHWISLCDRYPIVSVEDPLGEEDWSAWRNLTERLGDSVQLVGDDLFATRPSLLQLGIDQEIANAVVIKPNQVGTLSRTLHTIDLAHSAGYASVMAQRAGDTEDTTIADLAVAANCRFIKAGAPARSERVAKYNQLLRIEEELGADARYAGQVPTAS